LAKYYAHLPTEKVYLHLDKPFYLAGDTIWFKAYLQNDLPLLADSLSQVLYVELIHPEKFVVKQLLLRVENGVAAGDFILTDTLSSGQFGLRAYTQWMRNFGEDQFYNRSLQVLGSFRPAIPSVQRASSLPASPVIQFFPEGGSLVTGLRSRVAIKGLDASGYGLALEGSVYDNEGIKTAVFKSNALGMGHFYLTPAKGRTYTANIRFVNGQQQTFPLPTALDHGFVLHLDPSPDNKIRIRVFSSPSPADPPSGHFTLIAQSGGKVFFSASDVSGQPAIGTEVAKSAFLTGVVHFTLFDGHGIPQCERLLFVQHADELQIKIGRNKLRLAPGDKPTLTLLVEDQEGNPVEGDFSLSITDAGAGFATDSTDENILTRMLLTSELKGLIEQPGYYFQNRPEATQALDNLMLTQGWRRFQWQQLLNDTLPPVQYRREKGLTLAGLAQNRAGKILANTELNLVLFNQRKGILNATTNAQGRFSLHGLDFRDQTTVIPTVGKKNGEKVSVILEGIPSPSLFNRNQPGLYALSSHHVSDSIRENSFRLQKGTILLQEVKVKARKIPPKEALQEAQAKKYAKVHGLPDYSIDSVYRRDVFSGNIINGLQGRVPGMQVIPSSDPFSPPHVVIRGVGTLSGSGGSGGGATSGLPGSASGGASSPLYLLDGIQVDANDLMNLSASQVDHIDVLVGASGAIYGARGANGVIAVYTRKGDDLATVVKKSQGPVARGFYEARTFYTPPFPAGDSPKATSQSSPSTIYWNPRIITNQQGSAQVSFVCASGPTTYEVVLEGQSIKGHPGRKVMRIQVEK
jgi:hypothetical protein